MKNLNIDKNRYSMSYLMLFVLFIVIFSTLTSAAVIWRTPVAGSNQSATMSVNITLAESDCPLCLNASIFYNTSGGRAVGGTFLTAILNTTSNSTEFFNSAISISSLTDLTTYNFTAVLYNATSAANGGANGTGSAFTIDNTNPSCTANTAIIQKKNIELGQTNVLTCACTDATSSVQTTTRTLTKPGSTTVSISSSPYTTSRSDVNNVGSYTFLCDAADYAGNSATDSSNTFTVNSDDSDTSTISTTLVATQAQKSSRNKIIFYIIGIVIIAVTLVIVVISYASKGSKRRR